MATDIHHIIHKTGGLYLRYLVDNGVPLCRECHSLDDSGKLLEWCKEFIGEDKYYEMKKEGHNRLTMFDAEATRKELKAMVSGEPVEDYLSSST